MYGYQYAVSAGCYAKDRGHWMSGRRATAVCLAAILALNIWILARFFKTEYSPFMFSIEGAYIGISRWLLANWHSGGWFPLWYAGIPVENSYPPLLHVIVAAVSQITGLTVAHAHHAVGSAFYCLGPVAMFWLVLQLSDSRWKAFISALLFSLLSPSAFLMHSVGADLQSVWGGRRLQALVYYGEGPHVTSITLLLLALAAIYAALKHDAGWRTVLAVLAAAAAVTTNWLGAMGLVCGVLAFLITRREPRTGRVVLIAVLAYAIAMRWIPPTDIVTVHRNSQLVGDFPMGLFQYVYLALWLIAAFAIGAALKRKTRLSEGLRFALVFLFLMAVPPLGAEWFHVYPLPQPDRYHLEMEAAIAIVAGLVFGSRKFTSGVPRAVVVTLLLCLSVMQIPRLRGQVRGYLPKFDITKTVEREQALWLDHHYPGQRVFVEGSTRFWFNAFANDAQLGGGFDQGRSNPAIASAVFAIPYVKGNGADSVALLQAYGVRAIAVGGVGSRDSYRDYSDPNKFVGVVPEKWRDGGDAIYEIPGTGSLAHVLAKGDLDTTGPVDWPAVRRYAAAVIVDNGKSTIHWRGPSEATIQAELQKPDVVSVQMSWDPGWRASVNGADFTIGKDALGLMVLEPPCEGSCTIDLKFDGGLQGKISRLAGWLGFGACLLLVVFRRPDEKPAAEPEPEGSGGDPLYFRTLRALLRWVNRNLPDAPIADDLARFDPDKLRRAEAALRKMKMKDADGDRYLAKHIPRLSKTLALVPAPQQTGRVLELGCYMQITPLLERFCGYKEVRGAYYGPAGRIDRRTFDFPDGEFACYVDHFDVERDAFPYPDDYFDLVVAGEIVEHMTYDPMAMLIESRRVLAEGGYLLISTPNVGSVTSVAKTLGGRDNPQIFFLYERPGADERTDIGHVREYTCYELGEAVKAAGFEVELLFTTFIDEFAEHRGLLKFLAVNGYSTENRGEQTWCLARKRAALPVDRYPWFIYTP